MKFLNLIILFSTVFVSITSAYRILCVFPLMVKSHFIVFESVMKTLAKRGHQVDVVSHYQQKKPIKNYYDIVNFEGLMENLLNNYTVEHTTKVSGDVVNIVGNFYGNRICDFMGHEKFQKLVKNPPTDPPYDLVITEAFAADCYFGLGYLFKVPVVAIASGPEAPWMSHFIGNAENLAVFRHALHIVKTQKMSFWERLTNVHTNHLILHKFHTITEEHQTTSMRKYLRPDIPNIRDVEKNVALLLVNTHPVLNGVKPITPALVQIAGLHIEANEEVLSPELKQWMDESTHGVVYFSLGSIVILETLPTELLRGIYASFKKISPVRVLMKVVNDSKLPSGLPENVKTMPWIPQQPLLAHPNTKVFITHGGLGSTQEAFYFGIPTIGIPLFGDQFSNVDTLVKKEVMIRIDLDQISEQTFDSALDALLNNPDYKKNANQYSKLFRDNPTSQSEKGIFWIEYIIRNGGDSLKSPALQYSWYQLVLLDIYGFLTIVLILISSVTVLSIKLVLKKLSSHSVEPKNLELKKNK